ncbi:RagB/SusD family nutrient uptake outer membrane protein [Parapedobacter tibetensis]|uniref:RagB/SusD family nutrient uptake outer membrane protein n=1 Tax=Parapedobacter tibetensis TaxID=2972951 RepID=UPI00214D9FD1|nr:RagB/SusD family nutrient uptake outer membrane protein [Parapedobacter tibetensis]
MKTAYQTFVIAFFSVSAFVACESDFLERYPQSEISPQLYFNTEKDLETYTNSFYAYLPANNIYMADFSSDNVDVSAIDEVVTGRRRVPTDAASAGWTWSELYNINYFLAHYNKSEIPEEDRRHYGGVARFFRAYFYFEKLKRFGDVPWYGEPLDVDSEGLFKGRDPRTLIVDSIIADLDIAIDGLRLAKTDATINRWTALALKSRVCLFEGTFRKYHTELQLQSSATALLEASAAAANELINNGPYRLATGDPETVYLQLFAVQAPNANEFILSRLYSLDVNKSHPLNNIFTSPTRGNPGITKGLMDSYLLRDGRPFSALPNHGEMPFWEETEGRDPRLSQTVRTPGYRRIGADESSASLVPDYANAFTGYQNIKFVSTPDQDAASYTPLPIFRLAEVLLNYAEALAELGRLSQVDADRSINLLRSRVEMPSLNVTAIVPDPILQNQYDHTDDPLILEVRRERRVELALEGFRYYDLMRWKEGHLLAETFYGAYYPGKGTFDLDNDGNDDIAVVDTRPNNPVAGLQYFTLPPDKALSEGDMGNIIVHPTIDKVFDEEKDYYYPLPINELILNPTLRQNEGWPTR